jgi:hypothetical protein
MMGFSVNLFLLHLTVPFFIIVYERVDFIRVHVLCNKIIYYNMMSIFFVKKMCYGTGSKLQQILVKQLFRAQSN